MDQLPAPNRALPDLYDLLRSDGSFTELANRVVEAGSSYLDVGHGHLTKIVEPLDHWEVIATTDGATGPAPIGQTRALQTTFCRRAVSANNTLAIHDAPQQSWANDVAYIDSGWRCYLSTPIEIDDELYGTLCFADETARPTSFNREEIVFIRCLVTVLESKLNRRATAVSLANQHKLVDIFSRIMRHNLRNDLTIVRGHVDLLVDRPGTDPTPITTALDKLTGLADKSQQLKRIARSDGELSEYSITAILRDIQREIAEAYPSATVSLTTQNDTTLIAFSTVESALYELIENAVKHAAADAHCRISVEASVESVSVTVDDEGPGLPKQDQQVLYGDAETKLRHGSGVGLWIVQWVVESHDGAVEIDASAEGTSIDVSFPRPTANLNLIEGG